MTFILKVVAVRPRVSLSQGMVDNMARSVPEWVGKSDDTRVPPRVRIRVYDAYDGVCHIINSVWEDYRKEVA